MASLTPNAQRVATNARIGGIVRVYGPHTVVGVVFSLIAMAFGIGFTLVTAQLFGSDLIPADSNPLSGAVDRGDMLADQPTVAKWLPLFGLVFVLFGFIALISAIANRSSRVVLCQGGVAFATRKVNDAFAFADVASVRRRTHVNTTSSGPNGQTTTTIRYRTTVVTRDGRQFVIDSQLIGGAARKLGKIVDQSVKQLQTPR